MSNTKKIITSTHEFQTDYFKTKDTALSAALILNKVPLAKIERDKGICWFLFKEKDACTNISNNFYFGTLSVNAWDYHEALNRLKIIIFSET